MNSIVYMWLNHVCMNAWVGYKFYTVSAPYIYTYVLETDFLMSVQPTALWHMRMNNKESLLFPCYIIHLGTLWGNEVSLPLCKQLILRWAWWAKVWHLGRIVFVWVEVGVHVTASVLTRSHWVPLLAVVPIHSGPFQGCVILQSREGGVPQSLSHPVPILHCHPCRYYLHSLAECVHV